MTLANDARISVLIVEDHPIFREGLRTHLETQAAYFLLVGDVGTAREARQWVAETVPDIVLLDLGLPEKTETGLEEGLATIREIRTLSPSTQIIVLTAHRRSDIVFQAIQAGASAYLLKDHVTGQAVVESIRRVAAGDPPVDPEIARKLWDFFQSPGPADLAPHDSLTPREREVLQLIGDDLTNKAIAEKLVISPKTVKKHVSNILSKLQLRNRLALVAYYRTQYRE